MKTLVYIFILLWSLAFLFSVNVGIGDNPLNTNQNYSSTIKSVLPQGWGFFSKSPRSENIAIYAANEDSEKIQLPNMKLSNIFGAMRYGRSQAVESGYILKDLEEEYWYECEENSVEICGEKISKTFSFKNVNENPLICGEYYFTKEEVIPWSYSKFYEKKTEIKNMAKGDISCTKS